MNPIVVRDVTRTFGPLTAVDGVSLEVGAGEVVGLLGANGAGKTTLIKMILGLVAPTSGQIRLFGAPQGRELRRRVGYVPQNLGLYRDLTVQENLDFRARVFDSTPITTKRTEGDTLVAGLSLGQQRLVAFDAATQHHPDILVLDEPTSGVSPLARAELWGLIRERADADTAVLVSTHHMDEAEQADRLIIMSTGHVVASGTVSDIIGATHVVEVTTDRWADALDLLGRSQHLVMLAGRTVRVLAEDPEVIQRELDTAGIAARTTLAPATLDEVMVRLAR